MKMQYKDWDHIHIKADINLVKNKLTKINY